MKTIGLLFAVTLSLTSSAFASTTNTQAVGAGKAATKVIEPIDVMGARLRIGEDNGASQTLEGDHDSVGGGDGHLILGSDYDFIGGGEDNFINNSAYNLIGAGIENKITDAAYTAIVGGENNLIAGSSDYSLIGTGQANVISNFQAGYSVICGGLQNLIQGKGYNFIGGGYPNCIGTAGWYAVVCGGYFNTNNSYAGSILGGTGNLVTSDYGVAFGVNGLANLPSQIAHSGGGWTGNDQGSAQASEYVLTGLTTSTTPKELRFQALNASPRLTLPGNGTWLFDVNVVVRSPTGASGGFHTNGVASVVGGATKLNGTTGASWNIPAVFADDGAWALSVAADNAHTALAITVTGNSSTNRWVATIRTTEVKF
jgi:hypothetical protein